MWRAALRNLAARFGVRIGMFSARMGTLQTATLLQVPPMNRIRAARQALGWTQNELAQRAGVSTRTIHAIEKGRPCRQATKRHILNALGVPWENRNDYFTQARPVRRDKVATPASQAHSA